MKEYIEDPTFDPENPEDAAVYAARDAKHWEQVANSFAAMAMRCEHEAFRLASIIERMNCKLWEIDLEKRMSEWGNEVREETRIAELEAAIQDRDTTIADLESRLHSALEDIGDVTEWTTKTPTKAGWYWVMNESGTWVVQIKTYTQGVFVYDPGGYGTPIEQYTDRFGTTEWHHITQPQTK